MISVQFQLKQKKRKLMFNYLSIPHHCCQFRLLFKYGHSFCKWRNISFRKNIVVEEYAFLISRYTLSFILIVLLCHEILFH